MAGHFGVVSCLSQPHSAYSVIFLLKDESSILFQNWLDPSKEIKKQIRSEYLLMAGVCGWVGRAWLLCSHLLWNVLLDLHTASPYMAGLREGRVGMMLTLFYMQQV